MRLGIIAVVAALLGAGIVAAEKAATWGTQIEDGQDWRRRELLFLKTAYDRVQADAKERSDGGGAASLENQRRTLLRRMAEIGKGMPPSEMPDEVRALLQPPEPKPAPPEPAPEPIRAAAEEPPLRLETGMNDPRAPSIDLAGLSPGSDLRLPLDIPKRRPRPEKAADKAADNTAGEKPAGEKPAHKTATDKTGDKTGDKTAGDKAAEKPPGNKLAAH